MDRNEIVEELRRVQADFHQLVSTTTPEGLRRRSNGTRWSNRQLLYHMVFGYVIVRTLLPLVHALGRLGRSRRFAATLNTGHRPFHLINYLGSCAGGQLLTTRAQAALLDRNIDVLQRKLAAETDESLALSMHFPDRVGSLLQADHERARRLSLRHPALRPPSVSARPHRAVDRLAPR